DPPSHHCHRPGDSPRGGDTRERRPPSLPHGAPPDDPAADPTMRVFHAGIATIVTLTVLGATCPGALARPVRRLTHFPGVVDYWPRFSPDGTTVLFSHCEIASGCGGGAASGQWTARERPIRHAPGGPVLL